MMFCELWCDRTIFGSKDLELVLAQCENQGAGSPEQVAGFALAYANAKMTHHELFNVESSLVVEEVILEWAKLVEPVANANGYRQINVRFANMSLGLKPELISQAMKSFCEAFHEGRFDSPNEVYKEFEKIHPFVDGNGRIGHLLWASYQHYSDWPMTLPPKTF